MPNSGIAKTKSAPKTVKNEDAVKPDRMITVLALLGLLTVLVVGFLLFLPHPGDRPTYKLVVDAHPDLPHGQGRYGSVVVSKPRVYYLHGALTPVQQQKGLSGTKKLSFNQGMIFVYDRQVERCFWMKEMRYNLDIIWVDAVRKVTAVEQNLAPKTYPQKFCHKGKYVIELNAGEAAKANIKQGRKLDF
jgi:uncharacterized membrane protein (UPF0127 family)